MSRRSEDVKPITSPQLEAQLSSMLKRYNPTYALIYHIIISTGIDLETLLKKKVSNLYQQDTITFQGMHHPEVTHTEPIPKTVQEMINVELSNRNGNEYAFLGSRTGQKMHPNSFTKNLHKVSNICGCDPEVTVLSLHKTFVYHLYQKDHRKAYEYTSAKCPADMYKYLHISPQQENEKLGYIYTPQEVLHSSDTLKATEKAFKKTIEGISEKLSVPNSQNDDYYQKVLSFLNTVDSAVAKFTKDTTEENQAKRV